MKKKKKFLKFKIIAWCLVFFAAPSAYYFYVAAPAIRLAASAKIGAELSAIVNDGAERAAESFDTDGILRILRDSKNDIVFIQTDAAAVNRIARKIVKTVEDGLSARQDSIALRLGDFSGIPPLFGVGPEVKIKTRASGGAGCGYRTVFTGSGNQTLYELYLTVSAEAVLILPAAKKPIAVECDVLILESVIVGKIPAACLGGAETADVINLLP
ncbi:MAG: sporulation protein YunB [Clostridiales bacterium]|jgi:hypothetical protein|nr:sporulation protein YunB [Clostridiales bacterium]